MRTAASLFIAGIFVALGGFLFFPLFAHGAIVDETVAILTEKGNTVLLGEITHTWLSFMAAVIVFGLTLKYMRGGLLAKPIFIIGIGALVNAVITAVPIYARLTTGALVPQAEMKLLWVGSWVLSISVIVGVFWIAQILGVSSMDKQNQ